MHYKIYISRSKCLQVTSIGHNMAQLSIFINFYYLFIALVFVDQIQTTIIDRQNALTIKWHDDKVPEKVTILEADTNPHPTKHLAEYSKLYEAINGKLVLEATNFTSEYPDAISWTKSAGFVDTVFYSYQKHHNLIIRPDDIWTAIIVQFSLYVNGNAEELRRSFVNFEGKKELKIKFVAPVNQVPIDEFITKIVSLINENIHPSIFDWISPNFTTTTKNDKLTAGVALMSTLQKYFDYSLFSVLCGIPQATILGTVDDWREIRERVAKLKQFELNGKDVMTKWSDMLGQILDQFVSVKEGKQPDDVFWKQAIRVDYKTVDMVCATVEEEYLNGWITTFSAFDSSGIWQGDYYDYKRITNLSQVERQWLSIRTDRITHGIVQVPIKIYDEYAEPAEREYTGSIITGHMGYSVNKDGKTIQPLSGWTMAITHYLPQYLK